MISLEAVFEATCAEVRDALLIPTQKGFPDWGRQAVVLPVGALQLRTLPPSFVGRIGSASAREDVGVFLYLFARNEPELCGLLDLYKGWLKKAQIMVAEQSVALKPDTAERYIPEAAVLQERYAFVCPLTLTWSR